MNKKYLIILGFILLFVVIISVAVYVTGRSNEPTTNPNSLQAVFDAQNQSQVPQADKISFPVGGGEIMINNVFKNATRSADERYQTYTISPEVQYVAGGGSTGFVITARGSNAELLNAEKRFLTLLGITQSDGCLIAVQEYLITPPSNDSMYVRDTLSFCESLK